jgi:hypothetical protein
LALLGVWLGSWLTRNNEARNWRRDRCLEAYADVLRVCDEIANQALVLYATDNGTPEHHERNSLLVNKTAEMYRLSDRATLIGSEEIQEHLRELCLYCGNKVAAGAPADPKPSKDEWQRIRLDHFAPLFAAFLNQTRKDVRLS